MQKLHRCMTRQHLSYPAVKCYHVESMQLTKTLPITIIGCIALSLPCCLRHTLLYIPDKCLFSYVDKYLIRAKDSLLEADNSLSIQTGWQELASQSPAVKSTNRRMLGWQKGMC